MEEADGRCVIATVAAARGPAAADNAVPTGPGINEAAPAPAAARRDSAMWLFPKGCPGLRGGGVLLLPLLGGILKISHQSEAVLCLDEEDCWFEEAAPAR